MLLDLLLTGAVLRKLRDPWSFEDIIQGVIWLESRHDRNRGIPIQATLSRVVEGVLNIETGPIIHVPSEFRQQSSHQSQIIYDFN